MSEYQEGQTATNPNTGQKVIFTNGQWVSAGRGPRGELSVQDNKALNEMRDGHSAGLNVNRDYREVARALDRGRVTPENAGMLKAFIPEEGGGFFDSVGAWLGSPFIEQQTKDDWNTLNALQSRRVMDAQIAQKGPQTEADAARLKLAEVSPYKSKQANIGVMLRGMADATLAKKKLPFMQKWANKHGLNGVDEQGRTADEAWRGVADRVYSVGNKRPAAKTAGPVRIKGDADYDRLPSGAVFIAPDGSTRRKP